MAKSLERLLAKAGELNQKIARAKAKEHAKSATKRRQDQERLGKIVLRWAETDPKVVTWLIEQAEQKGCTKPQRRQLLTLAGAA